MECMTGKSARRLKIYQFSFDVTMYSRTDKQRIKSEQPLHRIVMLEPFDVSRCKRVATYKRAISKFIYKFHFQQFLGTERTSVAQDVTT
jgi:hypothetical protein